MYSLCRGCSTRSALRRSLCVLPSKSHASPPGRVALPALAGTVAPPGARDSAPCSRRLRATCVAYERHGPGHSTSLRLREIVTLHSHHRHGYEDEADWVCGLRLLNTLRKRSARNWLPFSVKFYRLVN